MPYNPPSGNNVILEITSESLPPVGNNVTLQITENAVGASFTSFSGSLFAGALIEDSFIPFIGMGKGIDFIADLPLLTGTLNSGGLIDSTFSTLLGYCVSSDIRPVNRVACKFKLTSSTSWFGIPEPDLLADIYGNILPLSGALEGSFTVVSSEVLGEIASFTGLLYAGASIEESFQLFNGSMEGDMASISGTLEYLTCTVTGVYAFNAILCDLPKWQADLKGGACIQFSLPKLIDCEMEGTVGQLLGLKAYFAKFDGLLYAGAKADSPSLPTLDGEITGHVSHVNRLTANIALFGMTSEGYNNSAANIEANISNFNSTIKGYINNPAIITGNIPLWTVFSRAAQHSQTEFEGDILKFTGLIKAHDSSPATIDAEVEMFTGSMSRAHLCVIEASASSQSVKFTQGLGL